MITCNWTNFSLRKLIGALTPSSLKHQMTDNLGLVDGSNHHFIKWQPRLVVRNRTPYISRARKKFTCRKFNNSFYSDHFRCLLRGLWKYFTKELGVFLEVKITFIDVVKNRKSSWKRKKSSWNVTGESREWLDFATQVKIRWMRPRSVQVSWLTNILAWFMELSLL